MTRRAPPVLHVAYDLALALYRIVPGFPKAQRFVLGQRIEQCAVDLLFRVDAARDPSQQRDALRLASQSLDQLRLLVRLALDLGFLSVDTHESLVTRSQNIGQQLGAWLRWAAAADDP